MIKRIPKLPLVSVFLLSTFAAVAEAEEGTGAQGTGDKLVLQQHTVRSNNATTVVRPSSAPLTDLQQRKQQSIQKLNKRAEDLVHAWKLRQVRQAIADIKAQEEKDALIAAAAAAREEAAREEAARAEALRNQLKVPPVPPTPPVLQPTPVQNAEVLTPKTESETNVATVEPIAEPTAQQATEVFPQPEAVQPQTTVLAPTPAPAPLTPAQAANMEASVEGPIDRMALASSLFATESYKECLSILKAVDQKSISAENRDWCDFLAACCYRKLNDLPEAESRYRSLLGRTEVSWLANATRWWLDHLNEQQKLRSDLQQLNSNFTAWQGEIDAFRDAD